MSLEEETTETPHDVAEEKEKDLQAKMKLVEDTITSLCKEDSEFADLREMGAALESGDSLKIKSLSGGLTNYSYKVTLSSGNTTLFSKICFEYALWNPDKDVKYDLSRVENEFQIMKDVSSFEPSPVVTPYHCVDVADDDGNKMKLLVTAWAPTDEQIVNQFIDGEVDPRVIKRLAVVLATLNTKSDFDFQFNENCRPCFQTMFPIIPMIFESYLDAPATDKFRGLCKEVGLDHFKIIIENFEKHYMTQEVLNHSDPNVFNILVEPKPSIQSLKQFGPTGDMVLCDWEMAFAGPRGKDPGWFQGFPVSAALAHAVHGHREDTAHKIFENLELFWEEYENTLRANGKDDDFVLKTYIGSLGWIGGIMLCYSMMGFHMDYIPVDDIPEEDKTTVLASIGCVGYKLANLVYSEDCPAEKMSLTELQKFYKDAVADEIAELSLVGARHRVRPRRASVLRTSGRRVSDAAVYETVARRASAAILAGSFTGTAQLMEEDFYELKLTGEVPEE